MNARPKVKHYKKACWIYDVSRFMAVCSHCMGNPTEGTGCALDISTLEAEYHYCRLCGAKMDEGAADE